MILTYSVGPVVLIISISIKLLDGDLSVDLSYPYRYCDILEFYFTKIQNFSTKSDLSIKTQTLTI